MPDVNVDGADTTSIKYDSYGPAPWQLIQANGNGGVFGQTLTSVEGVGGAVFRFHGTQVQVYGTLTPATVAGATSTSSYTLDGGNPAMFSSTSDAKAVYSEQDGQLFYDSGTLPDGDHVLVINVTLASIGEPYLLDYIKYTTTSTVSSSSAASDSATATVTATATPDATSASHKDIGPIVGGVLAGVLGLALFLGLFFFFRCFRHRISLSGRRRGGPDLVEDLIEDGKPGGSNDGSSAQAPFVSETSTSASVPWWPGTPTLHPHPPGSSVGPDNSASQVAERMYAAQLAQQDTRASLGSSSALASGSGPIPGSDAGPSASAGRDAKEPAPQPARREEREPLTVQHEDSGIRFRDGALPEPPAVDDLPPVYTPS